MTCCIFGHSLYNTIYVYIIWMHMYAFFVFFCIFLHTVCTSMQCCIQLHFIAYSNGCIHMHTFVVCIYLHNIAWQGALESCSHAMMHTVSFGVAPFWEAIKCVNMHLKLCSSMRWIAYGCITMPTMYVAYRCITYILMHTICIHLHSNQVAWLHTCCIRTLYANACLPLEHTGAYNSRRENTGAYESRREHIRADEQMSRRKQARADKSRQEQTRAGKKVPPPPKVDRIHRKGSYAV